MPRQARYLTPTFSAIPDIDAAAPASCASSLSADLVSAWRLQEALSDAEAGGPLELLADAEQGGARTKHVVKAQSWLEKRLRQSHLLDSMTTLALFR